MHTFKLMLGLVVLMVGAVATPVGAQAGAEGFLALQGVQAEALSDQEMEAIKGQEVPTIIAPAPSSCPADCSNELPLVVIGPCESLCGLTVTTLEGGIVTDTTAISRNPQTGEEIKIPVGAIH